MSDDDLKHDPKEDDPKLRKVIRKAEKEALLELCDVPRKLGFCHQLWAKKKEILQEKYGIDWKTPAEMNPMVCFD